MSFTDGWAALNMEMPDRVPRTEYSLHKHWEAIEAITGLSVNNDSPGERKREAQTALMKAWDFSFRWVVLVHRSFLSVETTDMGHAVFAANGVDYRERKESPFKSPEDVLAFDPVSDMAPVDKAEMIGRFEQHYQSQVDAYADAVNMTGVYISMVSGFIELFGWEMLLTALGTDPVRFGKLAQRYEQWVAPFFEALADCNVPVVMCHDDIVWTAGPICSPAWYREYIFPAYKRLWRPILDAGKRLVYTSDGDYTAFFDDIVDCGAHTLVMEPCCNMAAFAAKYGKTHGFIGNADTRILLKGDKDAIRAEVKRCMDIGKPCPGFFMAVGNHIPPNTPVESCTFYNDVYMEMRER